MNPPPIRTPASFKVTKTVLGKLSLKFKCPSCRVMLNSKFEEAGTTDTCPDCGTKFVVPGADKLAELRKQKAEQIEKKAADAAKEGEKQKVEQASAKNDSLLAEPVKSASVDPAKNPSDSIPELNQPEPGSPLESSADNPSAPERSGATSYTPTFDRAASSVKSKTAKLASAMGDEVTPQRKSKIWRYFFDERHPSRDDYPQLDWSRRVLHFVGRVSSCLGTLIFIFGILAYFFEKEKGAIYGIGFGLMVEGFFSLVGSQILRVYLDIERNTRKEPN